MFNIKYGGKITDEKKLIGNDKLPKEAVQYKEGKEINDLFKLGFTIMIPIMIPIMIITIIRLEGIKAKIKIDTKTLIIIICAYILYKILKYVHEFIHGILYPIKSEKRICKYSGGAFFLYCTTIISKTRSIIISLAPMIILGIIPFIIWLFVADKMDITICITYVFLTWIMIFFCMGDVANVYNTIKQVPKNAKVFNFGFHSYWIKE